MKKRKRRYKALAIGPSAFDHIFKKGIFEILESPIPKDAEYLTTHYGYERDEFLVHFYHHSFEIVEEGHTIPKIPGSEIKLQVRLKK